MVSRIQIQTTSENKCKKCKKNRLKKFTFFVSVYNEPTFCSFSYGLG